MNIPRDLLLDTLDPPAAADPATVAGIAAAWRDAEERVGHYLALLGLTDEQAFVREALRRAKLRVCTDPAAGPVRVALEELHRLLAEQAGDDLTERPDLDSVGARVAKWSDEGAQLRCAPPIRLRHMAPEKYTPAQRRAADAGPGPDVLGPTLVRSK